MKLFGNSKRSKHIDEVELYMENGAENADEPIFVDGAYGAARDERSSESYERDEAESRRPRGKRMSKGARVGVIALCVVCVLSIAGIAAYSAFVKPPEVSHVKRYTNSIGEQETVEQLPGTATKPNQQPGEEAVPVDSRTGEKYTFVLLGTDKVSGSTDTIMVATFDTQRYKLNVVSIPRDTLVNVSWTTKKVNTLYSSNGVDGMRRGLADILGYDLDFYAVVDLDAFVELIDAIGGVDYDVPINMNYDDPAQNLSIHVKKGMQHLDGKTAIGVMRFRKGYSNADIGRIGTQQDFLMTVARQLLANKDSIPLTTLAKLFVNDVKTDLTYGNVIWFAQEALKLDIEDINFATLPGNYYDAFYVHGGWVSYVSIYVNDWLEMVNTMLNPFDEPITVKDVNILTRNSAGGLYATSGVRAGDASWGKHTQTDTQKTDPEKTDEPTPVTPDTPDTPDTPPDEPVTPTTPDEPIEGGGETGTETPPAGGGEAPTGGTETGGDDTDAGGT